MDDTVSFKGGVSAVLFRHFYVGDVMASDTARRVRKLNGVYLRQTRFSAGTG
jgi:hypothetical protein